MYQFIRIGILYFQLKIVMLFIQFIVYTFVLPLISSYLLPHTLTSFIPAAKHINAVASSIHFNISFCIWCLDQSILMYVLPFPTSVSVCSSFNNWVSSFVSISTEALLLHKTVTPHDASTLY